MNTTAPPKPPRNLSGGIKKAMPVTAILYGLLFAANTAAAQTFSLSRFRIDGGSGVGTGGVFTVNGTFGQTKVAGAMTNGPFSLAGSVWALPGVVQNSNAPTLFITAAAPGFATISWAPATSGFVLQSSPSVMPPAWTNAPSGATNPVVVPASLPVRFYRLFKP